MMSVKTLTLISLAALALAGCATTQTATQPVDTFCLTAKKIRWSTADTSETIRQAEVINRTIDARCGIAGKASK
jgi:outer membrane lipoprotein SlyB